MLWALAVLGTLALGAFGAYAWPRRDVWRAALQARWDAWRQAEAPAEEPPATRYPLVLVHGLMGFDEVTVRGKRHEYFRGVEAHLQELGATVYRPRLPSVASVEARAEALVAYIRELPHERVNVIAHSMGGLDTRFAITKLGLADKVAALVTIGTPHRGTALADASSLALDAAGVRALSRFAGLAIDGFHDCTRKKALRLTEELVDARDVFYGSVVARAPRTSQVHPLLMPMHAALSRVDGANDGMVPAASQAWGEVLSEIEADHWAQVGWGKNGGFDALGLYAGLARELKARGF